MYKKSDALLERALKSIPLASQTFSKSITQYPRGSSPLFIESGKGARVWDVDGNEYIDFVGSLGAVTLGYCDHDVDQAITEQMKSGITFSLPHRLEAEVAELLIDIIPCAEKVRFAKNGTDVTSAAIRLSRAFTSREHVAVCGYHGWQDWYIGATSKNLGVPDPVQNLVHTFKYNDIASLDAISSKYDLAAIILEPMNNEYPKHDFLEKVKERAGKIGAVLIFDEMITGFRLSLGGAQELFSVTPDLATFGKGMANGMPISAIVGRNDIMSMMGDIFFSGTFGGETLSLAAAKATIHKYKKENVTGYLSTIGKRIFEELSKTIDNHKANDIFSLAGHHSHPSLKITEGNHYGAFEIKTLLMEELFKRGILTLGTHMPTFAHGDREIDHLVNAYDEVIPYIVSSINDRSLVDKISGEILKPLFKIR